MSLQTSRISPPKSRISPQKSPLSLQKSLISAKEPCKKREKASEREREREREIKRKRKRERERENTREREEPEKERKSRPIFEHAPLAQTGVRDGCGEAQGAPYLYVTYPSLSQGGVLKDGAGLSLFL